MRLIFDCSAVLHISHSTTHTSPDRPACPTDAARPHTKHATRRRSRHVCLDGGCGCGGCVGFLLSVRFHPCVLLWRPSLQHVALLLLIHRTPLCSTVVHPLPVTTDVHRRASEYGGRARVGRLVSAALAVATGTQEWFPWPFYEPSPYPQSRGYWDAESESAGAIRHTILLRPAKQGEDRTS